MRTSPSVGWRRLVPLALCLVVAVTAGGCTALSTARRASYRPEGASMALPVEQLVNVDVTSFRSMLVGLRGRPVLVNLWASWCGPCQGEAPLLRDAAQLRPEVTFVGVDVKDGRRSGLAFIDRHRLGFVSVADPGGDIAAELRNRGLPTTYLFAADGSLQTTITGGLTEQSLAGALDDLTRA